MNNFYNPYELFHHGRQGQEWGVRNGPPYPLSRQVVREAYGKGPIGQIKYKRDLKAQERAQKVAKKEINKRYSQLEKARKENVERITDEKEKKEIINKAINTGDLITLAKFQDSLTNEQISTALTRAEWLKKLNDQSMSQLESSLNRGFDAIDGAMKKAKKINDWGSTVLKSYENVSKFIKIIEGEEAGKPVDQGKKK